MNIINFFEDIEKEKVPENSILREFIGGSCFYEYQIIYIKAVSNISVQNIFFIFDTVYLYKYDKSIKSLE